MDRHIQGRGRFVRNDQIRVVGNRHGNHDALTHAPGELMGERLETNLRIGDPHQSQQLHSANFRLLVRHLLVDLQCLNQLATDGVNRCQGGQRILENHRQDFAANIGHVGV